MKTHTASGRLRAKIVLALPALTAATTRCSRIPMPPGSTLSGC